MWRLAYSDTCQFCGKQAARQEPAAQPPASDKIVCIWAFQARCCTECLQGKSVKELDLLMSDFPTLLMPALPFVFSTPDGQVIPPSAVERGQVPQYSTLAKLFWSANVDALRQEFLSVKELGASAVEGWLKGLPSRGAELRSDAAKWEKYDDSGGVGLMRTLLYPGYQPTPTSQTSQSTPVLAPSQSGAEGTRDPEASAISPVSPPASSLPRSLMTNDPATDTERPNSVLPVLPSRAIPLSSEGVAEHAKSNSNRRAEIIRRAGLLNPPLGEDVLEHNPVFHAATQLTSPLNDDEWDLLKQRLLENGAEAPPHDASTSTVQQPGRDAKATAESDKAKGGDDADWDEVQGPVRLKILKYADEAIIGDWDDGEKVTKDNAPSFAVDVLLHVRKRFYVQVAKDAAEAVASGRKPVVDPPAGPYTQKLTLENMKYVFDVKIRPLTEPLRKEIFLCNGCGYGAKVFGFEGVIQHYAAKHTTALSVGNVVVHWRSEWPPVPPFKPNPRAPKNSFHPLPAIPPVPFSRDAGPPPRHDHAPQPPGSLQIQTPTSQQRPQILPQQQPLQGPQPYGPPPYTGDYQTLPQDPYQPAGLYPPSQSPYGQATFPQPVQAAPFQAYADSPTHAVGYQPPPTAAPPQIPSSQPPHGHDNYGYSYGTYEQPAMYSQPPTAPYALKLEDMARHARELWMSTSNMKDLPGVVRVHVVLLHLDKFFRSRFGEPLSLAMFIDGLSNHKEMRPVRNINELPCKACYMGLGEVTTSQQDRKVFSLPQLANHFHSKHEGHPIGGSAYGQTPLNWATDMLLLPYPSALQDMVGSSNQFPMLAEAVAGLVDQDPYRPTSRVAWAGGQEAEGGVTASLDNHERFYEASTVSSSMDPQQRQHYQGAVMSPVGGAFVNNEMSDRSQNSSAVSRQLKQKQKGTFRHANKNDKHESNRPSHGKKKHGQSERQGHKGQQRKNGRLESGTTTKKGDIFFDEESKRAEEEERKQEDAIRAMWAADKTHAAHAQSTLVVSSTNTPPTAVATPGSMHRSLHATPKAPAMAHQRELPSLQQEEPRVKSVQRRNQVLVKEEDKDDMDMQQLQSAPSARQTARESDLLGALEVHLARAQERSPAQPPVPPAPPAPPRAVGPAARVVYLDSQGREVVRSDFPPAREPERHARYDMDSGRPRSPGYSRYTVGAALAPAAPIRPGEGYRGHSPPRHYAAEPPAVYETQPNTRRFVAEDGLEYERVSRGYAQAPQQPRQQEYYRALADDMRPASRPTEYHEPYELVRVMHPEGDYYVRRPVRREAPVSTSGYEYATTAYDEAPPAAAAAAGGGGTRPVRYGMETPVAPYTSYERPSYERHHVGRGNGDGPHAHSGGSAGAGASARMSGRDMASSYEEYDPHYPSATAGQGGGGSRQRQYQ